MRLSDFRPAAPVKVREPFDHDDFIFELKQDGFRALAHITPEQCQLVSRRGNIYKTFRGLSESLRSLNCETVLDGEIVILDENGRPQFCELLRRRGEPILYAFDCLMLNGRDLRQLSLVQRKEILQRIVREHPRVLFARHVERNGCDLFRVVCEQDLEGIVAKRKNGVYGMDWFKIRNSRYSQYEGRRELFERRVMVTTA